MQDSVNHQPPGRTRRLRARTLMICAGAALVALLLGHLGYGLAHRLYNAPSDGDFSLVSDFESGDTAVWNEQGVVQICCEDSLEIVTAPVRRGRYAARFNLRRTDPDVKGGRRAEVRTKAARWGREYWYAFSIFLTSDWPVQQAPVTVAQWHAVPDVWLAEAGNPPPFRLLIEDGQWTLAAIWDSKRVSRTWFTTFVPDGYTLKRIGPVDDGRWSDWRFRIRWSYGDDGLVEAWKDGQLAFRRDGANAYNDAFAPYLKVGLYIPRWSTPSGSPSTGSDAIDRHTVYFDEIQVTDRRPQTAMVPEP